MKITKKMLDNYQKYKREVPLLRAELNNMKTTDAGYGSSTVFDYRSGYPKPQSVVGFDRERYIRRQKALSERETAIQTVEKWIEEIPDTETRVVFRMRYIEGKKWEKIAKKLGYHGNPDYPRRYVRDKYLIKCGIR